MAAIAVVAAPSLPAAVSPLAGVSTGDNSNGQNSVTLVFSTGSGGADTISNAVAIAAIPVASRLYTLFNTTFATQADLDASLAALGFQHYLAGASAFALVTAAPGKPSITVTTTGANGRIKMSLSASVSA